VDDIGLTCDDHENSRINNKQRRTHVVRFVNLLTEDLERAENRERVYGMSHVGGGGEQHHRLLTLSDKRKTLRTFAERVCVSLCMACDFVSCVIITDFRSFDYCDVDCEKL